MNPDSDLALPTGDALDPALFERYWLGEASPAEMARVEAWFQTHPEQRTWYQQFGARLQAGIPRRAPKSWTDRTAAIVAASGAFDAGADEAERVLSFPARPMEERGAASEPAVAQTAAPAMASAPFR